MQNVPKISNYKWISSIGYIQSPQPFVKIKQIGYKNDKIKIQFQNGTINYVQNSELFDLSNQKDYNDMCQMCVLNQPQILNNIKIRLLNKQIFTSIGSTLLVVNPYQVIHQLFNKEILQYYKNLIFNKQSQQISQLQKQNQIKPHIYNLAGKAYKQLINTNKKQTIVISGQSGAGKTQCTKFCLQFLTSLSHKLQIYSLDSSESIEQKILKCNPILQAFGNSKTVRNDNSSRFGKFIQIFFDTNKNIIGANIKSYLLEKSRVVALEKNQRNYHCFYALTSSKKYQIKQAKKYLYLNKSNCFTANNINDTQNYNQITSAMKSIGFLQVQIDQIWQILKCILQIGNLQIDDSQHNKSQDKPCIIRNIEQLKYISKILKMKYEQLQTFLLFQRRKFLKQYLITPYNKLACKANIQSLSKQLYSKTFDFIMQKINTLIKPKKQKQMKLTATINILDIFGFQNFQKNSFQQICINFTNQKLLNLYNRYIFQRQVQLLKQDGLQKISDDLKAPNNNNLLSLIYGNKLSIFSLINDLTPHQQYKDQDILANIKKQLSSVDQEKNNFINFRKNNLKQFSIKHSQCQVYYNIQGFQIKNKDKVKEQIMKITQNLFVEKSKINQSVNNKDGKTLLSKFTSQIENLMNELESSNVHFIRCLKPNNNKKAFEVDSKYLLNQIRYLGIFQTIKIRRTIFPYRKTYEEFKKNYQQLFYFNSLTIPDLLKKNSQDQKMYILGKKRVYLSPELEEKLNKKKQFLHKCVNKIQAQYTVYKFRKIILMNLKKLVRKMKILKKYSIKNRLDVFGQCFVKFFNNLKLQREKALIASKISKSQKIQKGQESKKVIVMQQISNKQKQKEKKHQIDPKKKQQIKVKLFKVLIILEKLQKFSKLSRKRVSFKNLKQYNLIAQAKVESDGKLTVIDSNNLIQKQIDSKNSQNYISTNTTGYDSVRTIVDQNQKPYYNKQSISPQNSNSNMKKNSLKENKIYSFPQQFTNYNSTLRNQNQGILFKYNLNIPMFEYQKNKQKLKKLVSNFKKKQQNQFKKELKDSKYIYFNTSDLDLQTHKMLLEFNQDDFCEKYLRKRSKIMGKNKSFNQIFSVKRKPLQKSLSRLQQKHQEYSIKIFKQILRINQQGNQQFVLKVIEVFLSLLYEIPQQIINQTFLQLLKQINSQRQDEVIKIHRMILSFLHFFRPSQQFLQVGLYIFFQRIECHMYTDNEESFLRLVFQKTYKKYKTSNDTKYKPSKYQLYCLICKKLFPFSFYLSMGNSIEFNVQSDQTFAQIKVQILQKFGLNTERINTKYFAFFQIITFEEGQMQQIPISDDDIIWDVKSYWQIAISRYNEHKITPPKFYILVKLKFPFELHSFDYEGIQIMYSECFFDYFTGKVRVTDQCLVHLAWLLIQIKGIDYENQKNNNFIYSIFPLWSLKRYGDMILQNSLKAFYQSQSQNIKKGTDLTECQLYELKFNFIKILQKFPLTMSIAIPPQNDLLADSSLLYYLKPRRLYIVQKQTMQILQEYELKKLLSWQVDSQKLSFTMKQQGSLRTKTHIFYTEYAQIFCDYLNQIAYLANIKK